MKYKINLLEKKESSLLNKLTYFGVNYLRYIIVITQLIVIGVFFYRFQIDQSIIDLKDAVDQKKEIIQIVLPLLNEAAKIDKKTTIIEQSLAKQNSFSSMLNYFISTFPSTITLSKLEIKNQVMTVTGSSTDAQQLESFYFLLKKDSKFRKISFTSITKTSTGYDFVLILDTYLG